MIRIILKENVSDLVEQNLAKNFHFFYYLDEVQQALDDSEIQDTEERKRIVFRMLREIRPLHDSIAVEIIGRGGMGIAIALSNGNVLKIGQELKRSTSRTFNTLRKDNFSNRGSSANLHVYDEGEIKSLKFGWDNNTWSWREVPRYKTFEDHYKNEISNRKGWNKSAEAPSVHGAQIASYGIGAQYYRLIGGMRTRLQKLGYLMSDYKKQYGRYPSLEAVTKYYYDTYRNKTEIFKSLPEETAKKIVKAFYELAIRSETKPEELDVSANNLGIDQHGNFVFFDF